MRFLVCLFVSIGLALAKHEAYDGYAVYQISVRTTEEATQVNNLEAVLDLDIWSHALPSRPGLVLVAGVKKPQFEDGLRKLGIQFTIETDNVKELLDLEDKLLEASKKPLDKSRVGALPLDAIYKYEEIDEYLELIAAAYPETVTLVNAGKSFEGRDIKYLKISTTNFQDQSKPVVYMESLLHAREWVTLPATLYAIQKLVIDVTEQDLLQNIDWIIVPIVNPDGYAHTHDENRFWRKNRATGYMIGNVCSGVDLNRNFDVMWSEHSSNSVCSETFHGRGGFSEPETAIVRDILAEYGHRVELFLDIHSFGSMVLYGYGNRVLPANALFLHLVGVQMATTIDSVKMSYKPDYIVGNSAMVLYEASGTASDYAQSIGVPYAYTFELPGYRYGFGTALGFLVDPDFIEQAGYETWEGIKVGARYVVNNYRARGGAK